jgi:hypothetical protein
MVRTSLATVNFANSRIPDHDFSFWGQREPLFFHFP